MSEPFREGTSVGCGAALGLMIGLHAAVGVANQWAPPGVWYEWPVAVSVIGLSMLVAGWAVGKWGSTAVAILASVVPWCM